MSPSILLSIHLSVYPSTRLSVCPSVRLSVCPSVRLSVCPSVRLSVCPSVRLSVCPSVRLSVCPSVRLSVCPSVRLSVCPSVRLSVYLSVYISIYLSMFHNDNIFVCSLHIRCPTFELTANIPFFSCHKIMSCISLFKLFGGIFTVNLASILLSLGEILVLLWLPATFLTGSGECYISVLKRNTSLHHYNQCYRLL